MIIKDKTQLNGFNALKIPKLKGHVKITLHNIHNGKNEVIEGDNIVTGAIADIFANNYLGGIDYSKTMPLWEKWFGGILVYEKAHANLDADKYFPYAESDNHLVAHAGQIGIDPQHDDDMRAGYPVTSAYDPTENSIKLVWEWGSTHGNGTIRALSLTHSDTGDYGLGSNSYGFKNNFEPFAVINGTQLPNSNINLVAPDNLMAQYDENHGIFFHIGEESDWVVGDFSASVETTKITVNIRRFPYAKSGLFETIHGRSGYDRTFTVEIEGVEGEPAFSKLYCQPSFFFDYDTKKLWLFTNNTSTSSNARDYPSTFERGTWSTTKIHCIVIDCENEEIEDEFLITSDNSENLLVPLCIIPNSWNTNPANVDQNQYMIAGLVKDGNDVYFPTGTVADGRWSGGSYRITGYQKINVASQGSQDYIPFDDNVIQYKMKSAIKQGGLLVNSGLVVNDIGYACGNQLGENTGATFNGVWCYQEPSNPSSLVLPLGNGNNAGTASVSRYILANKLVHTTKYNLPQKIDKAAGQNMTIEYTLQEVSSNE